MPGRARRALWSPPGQLCLNIPGMADFTPRMVAVAQSCCTVPQWSMELFHCSSQSALNLQSAAEFLGWQSVITPCCIFLHCVSPSRSGAVISSVVDVLCDPLSAQVRSFADCLVPPHPPPVSVVLCCCLQGVGSGVNVSPHTAAEDAFLSKPAIDFLSYYFCSICDRLEVSFLIRLL